MELLPTDYVTFLIDCHHSHVVSYGKQRLVSGPLWSTVVPTKHDHYISPIVVLIVTSLQENSTLYSIQASSLVFLVQFWSYLVHFGMVWPFFGTVWYGLVHFGSLVFLVQFGMVWSYLVHFCMVWPFLVQFGLIWSIFVWFGHFWYSLVLFGPFLYGLAVFGTVWYGLGSILVVWSFWYSLVWFGVWSILVGFDRFCPVWHFLIQFGLVLCSPAIGGGDNGEPVVCPDWVPRSGPVFLPA